MKFKIFLICTALFAGPAWSNSEKVTSVDIYSPFYSAQGGKADYVKVYQKINALLLTNKKSDYEKASQIVRQEPAMITPMTMSVLAARAYDMGLRDEAVFWYFVARFRLMILNDVLDLPKMNMAEYTDLNSLVGSFILPYAACDLDKQQKIQNEALEWTKSNPYEALLLPQLKSKHSDRKKAIKQAEDEVSEWVTKYQNYFSDLKNLEQFKQKRKASNIDKKFCW
ncbi:hypothetical protein [Mannheimia massilioguelmaensis]|uniref:hypothetical protein n=1 Tax=Mannheimia massilioguelmaensis TaxID=1604354 RepID=UPI0005CA6415|nr:hypothetical protein [Mannheimia massilioguelmaensis]